MDKQPISREGYEKLREEIRRFEDEEMPKIAAQIAAARAEGDLSENAEYHGQREAQGLLQAKINQLKSKLANCYIADKGLMPKGVVGFGSTVTIKDLSDGSLEKYELVGPGEENYDGEIMKILTSSPIAQGLLGKKVGESVEVTVPRGKLRMEIVEIADA
jgi:transcription elongation factor GreA